MDTSNLAMLSFDGVHLLLPQADVVTVEAQTSLDSATSVAGAMGTLKAGGEQWPAYALDGEFKFYAACPPNYKFCVAINCKDKAAFAIACEEVGSISITNDNELRPLHACMRMPDSPIEALLLRDGRLLLLSDVEAMRQYLSLEIAA